MTAAPTSTPRYGRAALPGAVGMAIVGSSVAVSHSLTGAPLMMAQAIRYTGALPLVLLLVHLAKGRIVRPRGWEWAWLGGIAATGLVLFNVAVVRGVAHAEPAVIAVAVACVPVLLGVVGPALQGQSPRARIVVAAVVVTAGGVLVVGVGRTDADGVAWAAVALGCEAAFTLLAVPVLPRHGAWGVSFHSVWMGAAMFAALAMTTEGPKAAGQLRPDEWMAIAYLAVLVTAVAFLLWYTTVAVLGPARVGLLTGIAPIAAAVSGIIGGDGAPSPLVWCGMAVVVVGLALGLRTAAPEKRRWLFPRENRHFPEEGRAPTMARMES
jgi:drug/metabolite transporter (DMT)-like permease